MNELFELSQNRIESYQWKFKGNKGFANPYEKLLFFFGISLSDIGNGKNCLGITWNIYLGKMFEFDNEFLYVDDAETFHKNFLFAANFSLDLLIFLTRIQDTKLT